MSRYAGDFGTQVASPAITGRRGTLADAATSELVEGSGLVPSGNAAHAYPHPAEYGQERS